MSRRRHSERLSGAGHRAGADVRADVRADASADAGVEADAGVDRGADAGVHGGDEPHDGNDYGDRRGRDDGNDHGSVDPQQMSLDAEATERFARSIRDRIGIDRFELWFARDRQLQVMQIPGTTTRVAVVRASGPFELERIRKNFGKELRSTAIGMGVHAQVHFAVRRPVQRSLLDGDAGALREHDTDREVADAPSTGRSRSSTAVSRQNARTTRRSDGDPSSRARRKGIQSSRSLFDDAISASDDQRRRSEQRSGQPSIAADVAAHATSPRSLDGGREAEANHDHGHNRDHSHDSSSRSNVSGVGPAARHAGGPAHLGPPALDPHTHQSPSMASFIVGPSSSLAFTAATMIATNPASGGLVYFCGPTGVGKSQLLNAVGQSLRHQHRMRRVMIQTAEQFTNEFLAVIGKVGITDFRRRYRDVDALLIDDVDFFAGKTATMRELVHTINAVSAAGRPLVFAGSAGPQEIARLSGDLVGRLSSGMVCSMPALDEETARKLLLRIMEARCPIALSEQTLEKLVPRLPGDGRRISGIVQSIQLLQRMLGRSPDWDQIRTHCDHLLRTSGGEVNLASIEAAVCEVFGLQPASLRSGSQARSVSGPRMLAMYLSRQKTSFAYTEIAKHFGVRSHSTAIAAERNVQKWMQRDEVVGRGSVAVPVGEAVARVEQKLRAQVG